MHHLTRTLLAALAGACAALAALAALNFFQPVAVVDMDVDLPRQVTSGFYPVERTKDETFVWTTPLATVTLRGLDRGREWTCRTRLRAARPAGVPRAQVAIGVDGVTARTLEPGDAYEDVDVAVPPRAGASTVALTISTTPAYVPPSDPRELGVMLDEIRCAPVAGFVKPSSRALAAVAVGGAAFGALFAVLFGSSPPLAAAIVALALGLALLLTTGVAAYSRDYLDWILPVVAWTAGGSAVLAALLSRGRTLQPAAKFVLAFSSAVLCLKILALLHPSKEVVDAIFQAHRLDSVLAGNYYFTQLMPGGVRFPYAIGLYVTAAPWATLITDHVALLRIVVVVAEAAAAGVLYFAVVRAWEDRLAGAAAVVLYHAAPLSYATIGNANLTFAFGQSIATIAVVAAVTWNMDRLWWAAGFGVFALAALAFLSHVGVFPLVGLTLVAAGLLYALIGGPPLRTRARIILGASVLAALFAVGTYYRHFPEVYRTLGRVSASAPRAPMTDDIVSSPLPVGERAARAARIALEAYGLQLLALTIGGVVLVSRQRQRDRLTLALVAWGITCAVFLASRVLAPVDAPFQRYADEFIHRVYGMTLPAVAILAAVAFARGWRSTLVWQLGAFVVALAAVRHGMTQWLGWFR